VTLFRTAFPDIHFSVDNIIAEADQVAVQYTFTGTHTGIFGELTATGLPISVTGILIALVQDGKIERAVSVFDNGDMMHQLEPEHKSPIHHFIDSLSGHRRMLLDYVGQR
jgi:predicted ester cyclase